MPAPKKSTACPSDAACAGQFATLATKIESMEKSMGELKVYLKQELAAMMQKQLDDQSDRIRRLETFKDDMIKKLAYAMGGFAVFIFIIELLAKFLMSKVGG